MRAIDEATEIVGRAVKVRRRKKSRSVVSPAELTWKFRDRHDSAPGDVAFCQLRRGTAGDSSSTSSTGSRRGAQTRKFTPPATGSAPKGNRRWTAVGIRQFLPLLGGATGEPYANGSMGQMPNAI